MGRILIILLVIGCKPPGYQNRLAQSSQVSEDFLDACKDDPVVKKRSGSNGDPCPCLGEKALTLGSIHEPDINFPSYLQDLDRLGEARACFDQIRSSWTEEEQLAALPSCQSRFSALPKSLVEPTCECLLREAASRFEYDDFSGNPRAVFDDLEEGGYESSCRRQGQSSFDQLTWTKDDDPNIDLIGRHFFSNKNSTVMVQLYKNALHSRYPSYIRFVDSIEGIYRTYHINRFGAGIVRWSNQGNHWLQWLDLKHDAARDKFSVEARDLKADQLAVTTTQACRDGLNKPECKARGYWLLTQKKSNKVVLLMRFIGLDGAIETTTIDEAPEIIKIKLVVKGQSVLATWIRKKSKDHIPEVAAQIFAKHKPVAAAKYFEEPHLETDGAGSYVAGDITSRGHALVAWSARKLSWVGYNPTTKEWSTVRRDEEKPRFIHVLFNEPGKASLVWQDALERWGIRGASLVNGQMQAKKTLVTASDDILRLSAVFSTATDRMALAWSTADGGGKKNGVAFFMPTYFEGDVTQLSVPGAQFTHPVVHQTKKTIYLFEGKRGAPFMSQHFVSEP